MGSSSVCGNPALPLMCFSRGKAQEAQGTATCLVAQGRTQLWGTAWAALECFHLGSQGPGSESLGNASRNLSLSKTPRQDIIMPISHTGRLRSRVERVHESHAWSKARLAPMCLEPNTYWLQRGRLFYWSDLFTGFFPSIFSLTFSRFPIQ